MADCDDAGNAVADRDDVGDTVADCDDVGDAADYDNVMADCDGV